MSDLPVTSLPKTVLALSFIAVVAVVGVVVGTRHTVARGRVMAADLLEQLEARGADIDRIDCDDEIPIGHDGARFECTVYGQGQRLDVVYRMNRDGSLVGRPAHADP